MKVVLRQNVAGLGRKGEICDVADGYFRNLLSPRGLALKASKGVETQAGAMRRSAVLRDAKSRAEAEEIAARLVPMVITIGARAGEGGRLFGSVSTFDIVEAVEAQAGVVIDRHTLALDAPLKELGQVSVNCKLQNEVEFPVTVEVIPE